MQNYLPKILITGGDGQLAYALKNSCMATNFHLIFCTKNELDITDQTAIRQIILTHLPAFIINTAAFTAVDEAQCETEKANTINNLGAKNLAEACRAQQIFLFQISTDYVFDGKKNSLYRENDEPNPINFYGKTKYFGEQSVREICKNHLILRVSGIFSAHKNNFVKTIFRLAQEKKILSIVHDQIACPTYADDIAEAIFTIIMHKTIAPGTYHFCSSPPISWHQFAVKIVAEIKKYRSVYVEEIKEISAKEFQAKALRPAFSALDCNKIKHEFGILQPSWEKAISKIIAQLAGKIS